MERFSRVLKENLLRQRRSATIEHLHQALHAFADDQGWILERHGYRTPAQVRAEQTATGIAA